jgi:hypothetical protein
MSCGTNDNDDDSDYEICPSQLKLQLVFKDFVCTLYLFSLKDGTTYF